MASAASGNSHPTCDPLACPQTVSNPFELAHWLVPHREGKPEIEPQIIRLTGGTHPDIEVLNSSERIPWAGHSARYALPDLYQAIKAHQTTLIFVNTRSQAEHLFQALWTINEDTLPIALHHGSLDASQRPQG